MDTIIDILIIVALLAAAGLCIYLIMTLSRVNTLLAEVKNVVQSVKPVIANIQTMSTRLTPILDTLESTLSKLQPVLANLEGIANAAEQITQKVDRHIDQVLFALNDAARLAQDIIRLIDDIRLQIVVPVTGIAQVIGTAYKTVAGFLGNGRAGKEGVTESETAC